MSIADRWVRDSPQETVLANGRAGLPDADPIFRRTLAARGQAVM